MGLTRSQATIWVLALSCWGCREDRRHEPSPATSAAALTSSLAQTLAGHDTNQPSQHFASSLAAGADLIVAGTPWATGAAPNAGAAYVFGLSGGVWSEDAKLSASDGVEGADFAAAVATDGATIAVGDPAHDGCGSDCGAVYVFVKSGGAWVEQARLAPADPAAGARFGTSVAVAGDRLLVGAPGHTFSGAAYVFARTGGAWAQEAKLQEPLGTFFIAFGADVALAGDVAVVGAPGPGFAAAERPGAVHAFQRTGSGWSHQATVTPPDGAPRDNFGVSVAIDAGRLVVGANGEDDRPDLPEPKLYGTGAAYVFTRAGAGFTYEAKLLPPPESSGAQNTACCGPQNFMAFGIDVGVAGDRVFVGADNENAGIERSGAAYVFERAPSGFERAARLPPPQVVQSGSFGHCLAVLPTGLVVGAPGASNGALAAGLAHVFQLSVDSDGDGVQDPVDRCPLIPAPPARDADRDGCIDDVDGLDEVIRSRSLDPEVERDLLKHAGQVRDAPSPAARRAHLRDLRKAVVKLQEENQISAADAAVLLAYIDNLLSAPGG